MILSKQFKIMLCKKRYRYKLVNQVKLYCYIKIIREKSCNLSRLYLIPHLYIYSSIQNNKCGHDLATVCMPVGLYMACVDHWALFLYISATCPLKNARSWGRLFLKVGVRRSFSTENGSAHRNMSFT